MGRASRFVSGGCLRVANTEEAIDLGFAKAPNGQYASGEVCPYQVRAAEVRIIQAANVQPHLILRTPTPSNDLHLSSFETSPPW